MQESTLRELQKKILNLMKIFHAVCEKHQLSYYMIGGTMLGAVRHSGFIPWDDDADVGMPREDYLKLIAPQAGEDFVPARLGFTIAVFHRHQFLHSLLRGPDYDQETELVVHPVLTRLYTPSAHQ